MSAALEKLKYWKSIDTGYRRAMAYPPEKLLSIDCSVTDIGPQGFGILAEHRWDAHFGITFTCTDAELRYAQENAGERLIGLLYEPIISQVRAAIGAIMQENREESLKSLNEILDLVRGR